MAAQTLLALVLILLVERAISNLICKNDTSAYSISNVTEITFSEECRNSVTSLNVSDNSLNELNVSMLYLLTDLSAARNRLTSVSLPLSCQLSRVDYSHNQLTNCSFDNCRDLEEIDLSFNRIETIFDVIANPSILLKLKKINLSGNVITSILAIEDFQFVSNYPVHLNLKYNRISKINLSTLFILAKNNKNARTTAVYLDDNPIDCNHCDNYALTMYFAKRLDESSYNYLNLKPDNLKCAKPDKFKSVDVASLIPEKFTCTLEVTCPKPCGCLERPSDKSLVVDCQHGKLNASPILELNDVSAFENVEVHLEGNNIKEGPLKDMGYENVTKLFLSDNNLQTFSWVPPNSEIIELKGNALKNLSSDTLTALNTTKSLKYISLQDNPWDCGCDVMNLVTFVREHNRKVLNPNNITCSDNTTILVKIDESDVCKTYKIITLCIIIIFVVLLLIAAALYFVYYKYSYELQVWLYSHNLCLGWLVVLEEDRNKQYDAFVSYAEKDEDFVLDNFVPVLETGSNPYKISLHFRDGLGGAVKTDEIFRLVEDSRRTLVILSANFLVDMWSKHELRMAYLKAMTDSSVKVIIIIYGDLDLENLDKELDAYLKTNTYVKWGDPWFWDKLRYALPHSKQIKRKNSRRYAMKMEQIDRMEVAAKVPNDWSNEEIV